MKKQLQLSHKHELKSPLIYAIELMSCISKDNTLISGFTGHVISNGNSQVFIDSADDYNLSNYLANPDNKIIGRGVLVEQVWVDEWVVAWRPYEAKPEVIPWIE